MQLIIGIGIGIIIGAFIPKVLRSIKALFTKEANAVKVAVVSDVHKVEADVKAKL